MTQHILITGASGGFGFLSVQELLKRGHKVAAAMRDPNGRNKDKANALREAGAVIVEIDVTNEDSVLKGTQQAIEALGQLDVLINNAGIGTLGLQEFYSTEEYKNLFEVNVFGVQRMNRAVAPYFRKQQKGVILYVSSLLGRIVMPFYGPYQASKWALEAMAENYRVELSAFGIENCIVEPGGFPTAFAESLMKPADQSRAESYGDLAHYPEQMLATFENVLSQNPQQDPIKVAEAIADLIEKPVGAKPFRVPVDFIGMGTQIGPYNDQLEHIMTGLYTNFGTQAMLQVQPKEMV